MLKHATPRSSPSLSGTPPKQAEKQIPNVESSSVGSKPPSQLSEELPACDSVLPKSTKSSYNERGVDCEGIVSPSLNATKKCGGLNSNGLSLGDILGEKILSFGNLSATGSGIGPVITHGKAIVRRGLSFNTKKESDSASVRSIKSEGQGFDSDESKAKQLSKANSVMSLPAKTVKDVTERESVVSSETSECFSELKTKESKLHVKPLSSRSLSKKIFGISKNDHPSLKSLLRLPGVYGHIPVPESAPFGTPHILSPDSLSLNSSVSFISSNSGRTSSRSWSSNASSNSNNTSDSSNSNCSSTSEPTSTTLKIFAKCLRSDIEYKTVNVGSKVTCRQLINLLLSKARMRHRDPNLFYLTMEVTVRRWSGVPVRALLVLEESARPAQLALCRPSGDLKFVLQMRMGGIIKIHDTVLMPGSQYKSLLISYRTTAEDSVQLLLNCYGRKDSKHYYALHELCQSPNYKDRRLNQSEKPLEVKAEWPKDRRAEYVFVLRRNMTPALSLRKLSQRTVEQTTSGKNDDRIDQKTLKEEKGNANLVPKEKRTIEETLIDCTSTTPVMLTLVREESESIREKNSNLKQIEDKSSLSRLKASNNSTISAETDNKEHGIPSSNQSSPNKVSNLFSSRWQNSSCRVSFHSLPKQHPSNKSNNLVLPKDNIMNHIDIIPSSPKSRTTIAGQFGSPNTQLSLLVKPPNVCELVNKSTSTKILSSSAVQTELTCIPVRGMKTKYKWNSVETLLEAHYTPSRGSHDSQKTCMDNISSKPKLCEKNGIIRASREFHQQNKNCNCQTCFYI